MKVKKIPLRTCVVTKESLPKGELLRVVRTPEGNVIIDQVGKANGHGAYLSRNLKTIDMAQKKKTLDKALEVEVPNEIYDELRKIIGENIG